jgi:DNA-binding LacI/PurR family transcriptional regulator/serine phosphatase RsbU (regulator of sigma subunit)
MNNKERLTIGMFLENVVPFHHAIWTGVAECARKLDVNLLTFHGRGLRDPRGFRAQGNILYQLATAEQLDGLILGASIGNFVPHEALEAFSRHYTSLPMINIMNPSDTIPSIGVDNEQGLRSVFSHLIEEHGYRRIAFIKGPDDNPSAQRRYQVYKDILAEYHLPDDPALELFGRFSTEIAMQAMLDLLDRQIEFEAVVAANDLMAFGALDALLSRGISVPDRIAVTGFDDLQESQYTIPPLTTVRQPLYELGYRAVELLLARLQGEDLPMISTLSTQLVTRQSCGCHAQTVLQAYVKKAETLVVSQSESSVWNAPSPDYRAQLIRELIDILSAVFEETAGTHDAASSVLDAFVDELTGEPSGRFLTSLTRSVHHAILTGKDIVVWQEALSALRRQLLPDLLGSPVAARAENLWQQARVLLADLVQQAHARRYLEAERWTEVLRELGQVLINTFDVSQLTSVLNERLPALGIGCGYLCLYEGSSFTPDSRKIPEWSQVIMAYGDQTTHELEPGKYRCRIQQILPENMFPPACRYTMRILPLYFQDTQLGYMLLGAELKDAPIYEALRAEISSALQGALLVQRIQEHSQELSTAYEEIRMLNEQLKEENVRMRAELNVARRLQTMILPPSEELQQIEGLEIVGYMQPADEVGGDYYDVIQTDMHLHIGIGDVTGHGLESGVLMLMTQTAIRTLIEHGETDPVKFVNTLNRTIYKNARQMGTDKTLTFVLVNYDNGQLRIVGQHEELLVVRAGGHVERVNTINLGFPIGLEEEIAQWVASSAVTLDSGDGIVLYTDGITEAENIHDEQYGLERLCAVIGQN